MHLCCIQRDEREHIYEWIGSVGWGS
jgi:hypothetical protein